MVQICTLLVEKRRLLEGQMTRPRKSYMGIYHFTTQVKNTKRGIVEHMCYNVLYMCYTVQ